MKSFFITVFSLFCFSVSAQVDSYQEDIIKYLNVNGTYQQYDQAYDGMFDVLKRNFSGANIPNEVWANLKKNRKQSIDDVIQFLSFAYRKQFSQTEINELYAFYTTEAGKKMQIDPGLLTSEENELLANFYKSDLGKKMDSVKVELASDISEISSHWSRDLFASKMSALVKLGYDTRQ